MFNKRNTSNLISSNIEKIRIDFGGKKVTAHKLTVASEIPINIETAWKNVKTSALLEFIAKGKIDFVPAEGEFPEIWKEGTTVTTKMLAYGSLPFGGLHTIHFEKIDEENRVLQTKEKDNFAKVWDHRISMKESSPNSIYYEDVIIIYGGVWTGVISWWAKSFYIYRQKRWHLLAE